MSIFSFPLILGQLYLSSSCVVKLESEIVGGTLITKIGGRGGDGLHTT